MYKYFFCIFLFFYLKLLLGEDMNKLLYKTLVKKNMPKERRTRNCLVAFLIGGLVGVVAQFLIEFYSYYLNISTKDASSLSLVTLIFFASLFTALGFFDKWVTWARCGLIIPITGFAHSMTSAGIEYKRDGLIYGIGSNIFKLSGSVILYGIISAWFFGFIRYLLGVI